MLNQGSIELYHHGIPGMKWFKRNGPPYPLKESQKSSAEKKYNDMSDDEKKSYKEGIKNRKSAEEIYKNKDIFTFQELQELKNRINLEKEVAKLVADEQAAKKGKNKVDKMFSVMDDLTKKGNSVDQFYQMSKKISTMMKELSK